ncbi:MAG: TetR/AcrR family transcriptional regulator [Flavobacteriales bacterium]|nr:TetR/AcrR family transcriptional regulator [Flavobacteriales bacterium]
MSGKAQITTQFIIETVAPVFNRMGYAATSMSDITRATGLTKGAIYGNFDSKEHLAIEAFNFSIRRVIGALSYKMNAEISPRQKLRVMTQFYREYYESTHAFGGCPLLNIGVDANHFQPVLHERIKSIIRKLQANLATIIREGQTQGEFRADLNPDRLGALLFSHIQGANYTSVMLGDPQYLCDMMDWIDQDIDRHWMN